MGFPPISDVVRGESDLSGPNIVTRGPNPFAAGHYEHLLEQIPAALNQGARWEIHKTEWSEKDEKGYQAFVKAIGRSGCISIDDCLRSPANPYRDLEDETLWLGDCTDMVYVLRGYYAWKNGLPFSYQDGMSVRKLAGENSDLRYTKFGNRVVSRRDIIHPTGRLPHNAPDLLTSIFNVVSTAMLRTHPEEQKPVFSDFYPVRIDRDAIVPGTVAYDIYGHVSIVYDITDDGRILMISSHPDYTVSRDAYGANILRSGPELGSGLKAWRPIKLVGATRTSKGTYVGGRIVGATNASLPDYSLEQYYGTHPDETGDWEKGRFLINGSQLPYYDFVRTKLRDPSLPYNPLEDFSNATAALCASFRDRRTAVNMAVYAKVPEQPAPEKLPENIYGTYGDWERYATPSRDARLKTQAVELRQLAEDLVTRQKAGDVSVNYPAGDLAAALLDIYDRSASSCRLNYKRTDGTTVKLTMHHAMDRLFDLSFDPYHCPERRWGATGKELATCPDGRDKEEWYEAQRFLRYDPDRTYDVRTDFSANELRNPARADAKDGGVGRARPPDVNLKGFLEREAAPHLTESRDLPVTIIRESGAIN